MNEWKPPLALSWWSKRGADCERKPPRTYPLHTSANQETRSDEASRGWTRRTKVGGVKISLKNTVSRLGQYEEGWQLSNWRRDHIQKHANWNPRELASSDHNPLPQPPTQGRTSQRPKQASQFRPRTTTRTPSSFPPQSSSLFISPPFLFCSSSSLCLLLFVPLFF